MTSEEKEKQKRLGGVVAEFKGARLFLLLFYLNYEEVIAFIIIIVLINYIFNINSNINNSYNNKTQY